MYIAVLQMYIRFLVHTAITYEHAVSNVDVSQGREYTYTYEEGKIVRTAEHTIEIEFDMIHSKVECTL